MTDVMITCQCGVERLRLVAHDSKEATVCECPECTNRYAICYADTNAIDVHQADYIEDCYRCGWTEFDVTDFKRDEHVIAECQKCGLTGEIWFATD